MYLMCQIFAAVPLDKYKLGNQAVLTLDSHNLRPSKDFLVIKLFWALSCRGQIYLQQSCLKEPIAVQRQLLIYLWLCLQPRFPLKVYIIPSTHICLVWAQGLEIPVQAFAGIPSQRGSPRKAFPLSENHYYQRPLRLPQILVAASRVLQEWNLDQQHNIYWTMPMTSVHGMAITHAILNDH